MRQRLNGRRVHFVVADGREAYHGECRPALVVNDWGQTVEDPGAVNLVVFRDGGNESEAGALAEWRTSTGYSAMHEFGTWHFADDCEAQA